MKLPSLEQIDAELARRSLSEFIKQAWHVVEPATPYVHGWHIDAICEHLEAVSRGQIRNLLINMPPRHAKSLIVSVFWPCWEWLHWPEHRWLFSSYAQVLSTRDSLKCRRLIQSPWYRKHYGHIYQLSGDQNQKTRFENNQQGYRIATSVGGSGTGEGGDRIVVDDPHNVSEGESDAVRQSTLQWWDETMSTRGNDPKTVAKLIIMQRVNQYDLSGHVLAQGGYEHLCLPAEFESPTEESPRKITSIGWTDPRQEEGELLWPERFGQTELDELKLRLGIYGAAGQFQQRPSPRGGGLIKEHWFKPYKALPKIAYIIQSWDTAFKTKQENDYSVCLTVGISTDGEYYLINCYQGKLEFPELKKMMAELWFKYQPYTILIEDKASGQSLIQEMKRPVEYPEKSVQIHKLPIKDIKFDIDKVARANACTTIIETNVFIPEAAHWKKEYVKELTTFPAAAHDDQVDATTQALIWLAHNKPRPAYGANVNIMGR
jgi:predicted phage terminase large subunit-like protein